MNKNEIRKAKDEMLSLFGAETLGEVPDKVMEVCLGEKSEVFDRYLELHPDLSEDHLSEKFQILFADRVFLNQDFTPNPLARLMAELAVAGMEEPSNDILDECAGTGVFIINYWAENPDARAYCRDISGDAIPFLLFNLMVRNIPGFVVQGDTLTLETLRVFALDKGEKYSSVTESPETLVRWFNERRIDPLKFMRSAYNELNGTAKAVGRIASLLRDKEFWGGPKQGKAKEAKR